MSTPTAVAVPLSPALACPGCRATEFRTSWASHDGGRHVRLDCARCGLFVRWLGRPNGDFRHERRPWDAHAGELEPPGPQYWWMGHVRLSDGLWRPVALARTLHGCWEALLAFPGRGDMLAVPCQPPPGK